MDNSDKTEALTELVNSGLARRDFAKRVMIGGLAAYGVSALGGGGAALGGINRALGVPSGALEAQSGITDADVLNFALNLEYLEAEFYTVATSGQRLSDLNIATAGKGQAGATVGGGKVSLDDRILTIASQIAVDERAHVAFLRTALGGDAVAKPAINLAALGIGFNSQTEFLTLAAVFEDVGVSAYAGAAPLLSSKAIIGYAARIAETEAQHAGVLRLLASDNRLAVPQVDAFSIPTLSQANGRLFFVDGNGLSIPRTTSDVLRIVYGGGSASGGFFPTGFNGTVTRA